MISKLAARTCPALLVLGCVGAHAQSWLETRIAIEEFAVDRNFESAFELGDEFLAQAEAEFGAASTELAEAHLLLASLYRQRDNFEDAELHLLRAIDVIELRDGEQTAAMIQPLLTLGDTYFNGGSYPEALARYEEARAIGRREFGILNTEQLGIIQRMSASALLMGDYDQARELQREAVGIVQRVHGDDSIEFVDAQFVLAAWYVRNGKIDDAERVYYAIENIARQRFADDPLLAIRILRTKALSLRNADPIALAGRTNPVELRQALDIAAALEQRNPLLEAEILRDIGDWYVCVSRPSEVAMPYMQAWALLDSLENGFQYQHDWFGPLTLLSAPAFSSRFTSREPDAPWGRVEVSFTLDAQGRASNPRITQSEPPGLLDDAAIRHILGSRFRPRMDRGRLVASEAIIGWDFQYDAAALGTAPATAPARSPAPSTPPAAATSPAAASESAPATETAPISE